MAPLNRGFSSRYFMGFQEDTTPFRGSARQYYQSPTTPIQANLVADLSHALRSLRTGVSVCDLNSSIVSPDSHHDGTSSSFNSGDLILRLHELSNWINTHEL